MIAELTAILIGLRMAWHKGFRIIRVDSNSHLAMNLLTIKVVAVCILVIIWYMLFMLKINLKKCRCIVCGLLSREFYIYGDVIVCRNFLIDVEKYLII